MGVDQQDAYADYLVSTPGRDMAGWRDSDGDQIFDVGDTGLDVTLDCRTASDVQRHGLTAFLKSELGREGNRSAEVQPVEGEWLIRPGSQDGGAK